MSKEKFLTQFFTSLNEKDIDYFVIGNYQYLPNHTGGSDLDLYVNEKFVVLVNKIIKQLVISSKCSIVSYYTNTSALFFRIYSETGQWGLQLDVLYKPFFYQNKPYFPIKEAKGKIILHNNIKVLDSQFSEMLGFVKEVVHNGWAKDKYVNGFLKQYKSKPKHYESILKDFYGIAFVEILNDVCTTKELSEKTKALQTIALKRLYPSFLSKLKLIFLKISYLKRIVNKTGYTIVFLGTDGSGKSTIIDAITPLLNEAFHDSVYYEHMRPNKLPSIARLLGKKEDFSSPVVDPHAQNSSGFIGSIFRFSYYYLDYTLGYFLKVYPKKALKSCVWIFDRYYYDYLLDQKRARIKLPTFLIKLSAFFLPKPDMIICLGTDAEKIYARKPEISFQEVKRQVKDLKKFSTQNKRAIWIDTGVDVETSKRECLKYITHFMEKRFKYLHH